MAVIIHEGLANCMARAVEAILEKTESEREVKIIGTLAPKTTPAH